MEATGVYWRPIFHALCAAERPLEILLVNARHVKNVPGRKSDVLDAGWLAKLNECGLLRGSFIPPPEIAAIRELTRYRKKLIEQRTSEWQRLGKVLEDSGIKIDSVASTLTNSAFAPTLAQRGSDAGLGQLGRRRGRRDGQHGAGVRAGQVGGVAAGEGGQEPWVVLAQQGAQLVARPGAPPRCVLVGAGQHRDRAGQLDVRGQRPVGVGAGALLAKVTASRWSDFLRNTECRSR